MDLKKMQETLNRSKKMIKDLDQKFEPLIREKKLQDLDREYKRVCRQFSPAYLAGSSWYVGESLLDSKVNDPLGNFAFFIGCMANRYDEINKN